MKVLLINGSPHKDGCTNRALCEVAKELNANGIDTEITWIGTGAIHGCIACGGCSKTGKCVFDDGVNEISEKMSECDGLVVGTPVYYASPNGSLLAMLDRLFGICPDLAHILIIILNLTPVCQQKHSIFRGFLAQNSMFFGFFIIGFKKSIF